MRCYRSKRDAAHRTVASKYKIVSFVPLRMYGRAYEAISKDSTSSRHAINGFRGRREMVRGVESEWDGSLLDLTNPKMVVGLRKNLVALSLVNK